MVQVKDRGPCSSFFLNFAKFCHFTKWFFFFFFNWKLCTCFPLFVCPCFFPEPLVVLALVSRSSTMAEPLTPLPVVSRAKQCRTTAVRRADSYFPRAAAGLALVARAAARGRQGPPGGTQTTEWRGRRGVARLISVS